MLVVDSGKKEVKKGKKEKKDTMVLDKGFSYAIMDKKTNEYKNIDEFLEVAENELVKEYQENLTAYSDLFCKLSNDFTVKNGNLGKRKIAELLEISEMSLRDWERGKLPNVSFLLLIYKLSDRNYHSFVKNIYRFTVLFDKLNSIKVSQKKLLNSVKKIDISLKLFGDDI